MPAIAAPLIIPFAEIVGITTAGLALREISEMVQDYIEDNPEESMKVLSMLMPGQGLAQIFQNKSDKGDEEVSEEIDVEVEEKPKKLSGKEKGQRIKAAIKRARAGRGNYSSPDAEGSAVDIRGSVIREVEDMGIADKDLKDKYDPNKPKFNWRRFTKKNYAYGGGVQSLFEPTPTYHQYHDMTTPITYGTMMDQRRGFNTGGWADDLTGQALAVYNSMTSGGHDDAAIQAALESQGLWNQGSTPSANTGQVTGIINQNIGGGGDGDYQGGGKFGNLDLSDTKTFTKDVWSDTAGPPGQFDWTPTEVTGYMNPKTGQYQTFAGKNINHAGINLKPGIIAIAEALGFGDKWDLDEYGGIKPGSIKGTFTDGFKNPFSGLFQQKATIDQINAMNLKAIKDMEAKKAAEEAAKRAAAERRIISGGPVIQGSGDGGGGNITTTSGDTYAPGDYSAVAGTLGDPREKMDYYRDGGVASMFMRKR